MHITKEILIKELQEIYNRTPSHLLSGQNFYVAPKHYVDTITKNQYPLFNNQNNMTKTELTKVSAEELTCYRILFLCSVRLMSDTSAHLQGELKFKLKQDFNRVVNQAERLVYDIEKTFSPEAKRAYEALVEDMNNEICKLRGMLLEEMRKPKAITEM